MRKQLEDLKNGVFFFLKFIAGKIFPLCVSKKSVTAF